MEKLELEILAFAAPIAPAHHQLIIVFSFFFWVNFLSFLMINYVKY